MYTTEEYFKRLKLEEAGGAAGGVAVGTITGTVIGIGARWAINKNLKRLKKELTKTSDPEKKASLKTRIMKLETRKEGIVKRGAKKGAVGGAIIGAVAGGRGKYKQMKSRPKKK